MEILEQLKQAKDEVNRLDTELKKAKEVYESINQEAVQQFLDGGIQSHNFNGYLFSLAEENYFSFNAEIPDETRKEFLRDHQLDYLIKETINAASLKRELKVLAEAIGKDELLAIPFESESEEGVKQTPILNVFEKAEIRIKKAVQKKSKL